LSGQDGNARPRLRVVYWTNQPSPYTVGRLNAVAKLDSIDLCVWFDEERQPDRSWSVDSDTWEFESRWVPTVEAFGRRFRLPIELLMSARPNLVVQLFDTPATALGALVSRAYADRVAFRVLPAYEAWGRDTILTRAAKRFLFRAVDAAKVPGGDGAARATRFGLARRRCIRVRQTIDVAHYRRDGIGQIARDQLREQYGLQGTAFVYVGRLWKGKGIDYLLRAFAELRQVREDLSLLLVGDGVDADLYHSLVGDTKGVAFAGFVQPDDLPRYYAACDVLVFPTLGDPHGLVVEEAMAAGLAVLSSDAAGDILERVEGRAAGVVVPRADHVALRDAMAAFANDPKRVAAIGRANEVAVRELEHTAYAKDFEAFAQQVMLWPRRRGVAATVARGAGLVVGRLHARRTTRLPSLDPSVPSEPPLSFRGDERQ
jgi:glycosyltransferase involved in cell wall biosynthesis